MADELYNIVFSGKIEPGFEIQQVKDNLARLFNASEDKVEVMFSGKAMAIKKSADRATVDKYCLAMKKAGAIVQICTLDGAIVDFGKPQNSSEKENTAAPEPEPTSSAPTPPSQEPTNNYTIAPIGVQIIPPREFVEASFNLDGLSVAPAGADVTDPQAPPPPFEPDLSSLTLEKKT